MLDKALIEDVFGRMRNPPSYRRWLIYCRRLKGVSWNECWQWMGGKDKDGYGKTSYENKHWRTHRLILYWTNGPLPKGYVADHSRCDDPPCCNPTHLTVTTSRLNTLRSKIAPSAINARKTHCPRGHELSGDNLYKSFLKRGLRSCRICTLRQNAESLKRRMKDPIYAAKRKEQKRLARKSKA